MNRIYYKKTVILLTLVAVLVPILTVSANVFVDWRGKFKVEYPDSWRHVPYEVVDQFLVRQGINPEQFRYDAVLAQDTADKFEEGAYLFITLEPVGELDNRQMDSTLRVIAEEYGKGNVSQAPALTGTISLKEETPTFDSKVKTVVTKSYINTSKGRKVLLDFRKFYDQGLAVFLCYTYEKDYGDTYKKFFGIVNSFTTEDLHSEEASDSLKIVDLSEREEAPAMPSDTVMKELGEENAEETGSLKKEAAAIIIPIAVVFLIVAVLVIRRRKKR